MNVLIVDDHLMIRQGLGGVVADLGWTVVDEAGRVSEAIVKFKTRPWSLGIIDIQLPDGSGLDLLQALRKDGVKGPILVHSMLPDASVASRVFKLGGNGFVNKGCAHEELTQAIRRVASGGRYVSPGFAEEMAGSLCTGQPVQPHDTLSDREYQVLCQIGYGKTPSQIAEALGCNINTISTYRSRVLAKLKLRSSMELMRYTIAHGLINL